MSGADDLFCALVKKQIVNNVHYFKRWPTRGLAKVEIQTLQNIK